MEAKDYNRSYPVLNPLLRPDSECMQPGRIRPRIKSAGDRLTVIHPSLREVEVAFDVLLPRSYTEMFYENGELMRSLESYRLTSLNAALALAEDISTIYLDFAFLIVENQLRTAGDWEACFDGEGWPSHLIVIGGTGYGDYYAIEAGVGDDDPPVLFIGHDPPCCVVAAATIGAFVDQQRSVAAVMVYNGLMTRPAEERAALAMKLMRESA